MNPIRKAQAKPTRVNAIRAYCYDCMGGRHEEKTEHTIGRYVSECSATACPLWTVRPWRNREQKLADLDRASQQREESQNDLIIASAYRTPTSKAKGIKARCWQCVGGTADHGARSRIRDCQCTDCPLWPVRPYQKPIAGNLSPIAKGVAAV